MTDMSDGSLLIPETQMELDVREFLLKLIESMNPLMCFNISFFQNLTEYNTAHNRRISMLGITDDNSVKKVNKSFPSQVGLLGALFMSLSLILRDMVFGLF